MKALTIDAPWAWAIVHGHKRVENRTWRTNHRGPLAIHAGRSTRSDAAAAAVFAELGIQAPTGEDLDLLRGRVLGVVDVVGVANYPPDTAGDGLGDEAAPPWLANDPFATGPRCWVLANPVALSDPNLFSGKQGLWTLPDGLI